MSHQGAQNFGAYEANSGGCFTPQAPNETTGIFQERQNAFEAEQRRLAELRKMQGGY
jgi:hypothetical protein